MRLRIAAMILMISVLLTACWDRREVNDVAFVMGTAFDKEEDLYRVTIQIALPGQLGGAKGGGGGTSGKKGWYLESKTGETIREANQEEQKSVPRILNFSHRRVLVIGEEMARAGVEPMMDVLARIPQNRLTSLLIVTKGPALKVLNAEAPAEQFPAEALRELAVGSMKIPRTLKIAINAMLSEGIDLALPAVSLTPTSTAEEVDSKETPKMAGLAVFKNNKLAGFLEGDEANGVLWAMGQASTPEVAVEAPKGTGKIIASFVQYDTALEPIINGDDIVFRIKINGIGTVIENESNYQLTEQERIEQLEKKLKEKVSDDVKKGIRKLQELESDAAGFGKTIYNKKPDDWERLKKGWYGHFKDVRVEVLPELDIENIGSTIKPFGRKEEHLE
jgi:spore germination protein KC